MAPTLRAGEIVLTVKTKPAALRSGLIYVIDHSDLGKVIKRLGAFEHGRYRVIGDNPASTPSAVMGTIEPERITRRAVLVIGSKTLRRL